MHSLVTSIYHRLVATHSPITAMASFAKFPSIGQFRHVVKDAQTLGAGTVAFTGTVKLHGTNGGIGWNGTTLSVQSHNRIITPKTDNHGFAAFVASRTSVIEQYMRYLSRLIGNDDDVYLFGEWCGRGIQKGVAIAELEPMFIVFSAAHRPKNRPDDALTWMKASESIQTGVWMFLHIESVCCIYDFPYYTLDITFDATGIDKALQTLTTFTNAVDQQCPVAYTLGVDGIGEGIVWHGMYGEDIHLRFKVKGTQHTNTKVTPLVSADVEKLSSIAEFITYSATEVRMDQGLQEITGGQPATDADIGPFIRWILADIVKEEHDTMLASAISTKALAKPLAATSRAWIIAKMTSGVLPPRITPPV
jgi:hypothetical protein